MAKDLKEQIEIMTHYLNGGEVEFSEKKSGNRWTTVITPSWDWAYFEYRIKEQKQKVTIEKWLCRDSQERFVTIETSKIENYIYYEKIKLIESYEIEL